MSDIIVVTGGNGFLAAEILKQLCETHSARFSEIRTTVRNPDSPSNAFLKTAPFKGLKIYAADLTAPGSFDKAIEGATFVMHVASPFSFASKDPQKELVEPAIQGAENVLKSCEKTKTVKRLVFTSSVAALTDFTKLTPNHPALNQDSWNTTSTPDTASGGYRLSKTLAERKVWEYYQKWQNEGTKIEVISLNPSVIVGAQYNNISSPSDLGQSNRWVYSVTSGEWKAYKAGSSFVSCRDVAKAHILALDNGISGSRYPVISQNCFWGDVNQVAAELFPNMNIKTEWDDNILCPGTKGFAPNIDNSKTVSELGMKFEGLKDIISSCDWISKLANKN